MRDAPPYGDLLLMNEVVIMHAIFDEHERARHGGARRYCGLPMIEEGNDLERRVQQLLTIIEQNTSELYLSRTLQSQYIEQDTEPLANSQCRCTDLSDPQ